MTSQTPTSGSTALLEHYLTEDEALTNARQRASELGCAALENASGAALRFLASAVRAKAVVEIGTGAGVSGLCLLRGMAEDGILTSIDVEPEYHRAARKTFSEAGYPASRARLIIGGGLEVLPRLTSSGYDLVFVDAAVAEYPGYYEQGVPLLRTGGVIALHNVLADGRVDDPTRRDPDTRALRELARVMRADERLAPALLPVGGGLLVASIASE